MSGWSPKLVVPDLYCRVSLNDLLRLWRVIQMETRPSTAVSGIYSLTLLAHILLQDPAWCKYVINVGRMLSHIRNLMTETESVSEMSVEQPGVAVSLERFYGILHYLFLLRCFHCFCFELIVEPSVHMYFGRRPNIDRWALTLLPTPRS